MFGFTQSVVSLLVSHMDLDTGISFLSGAVLLPNATVTEVQLAGWEAALHICNAVSEILNKNSCQYVTLISQSQMLDGFFFFLAPLSLAQAESFSEEEHPPRSCSGAPSLYLNRINFLL